MSRVLAQDLKTNSKVQSLPDDLRKIAEELLTEKFGEEVVDSSTTFHGHTVIQGYPGGVSQTAWTTGSSAVYSTVSWEEQRFQEDIRATPDFRTRRIRYNTPIHKPTVREFRESIHRLKINNLGRRGMDAYINRSFLEDLLSDPDFRMYSRCDVSRGRGYELQYVAELFGVKIFLDERRHPCIESVE